MKKSIIMLISITMILLMTACGGNKETPIDKTDVSANQIETEQQSDSIEENSKTLKLFKEFFTGNYTLKMETYKKTLESPEDKKVSSTLTTVVFGDKLYNSTETEAGTLTTIKMDGYTYSIDDNSKIIFKTKTVDSSKKDALATFDSAEDTYKDMSGEPGTVEVFGKEYYYESFIVDGEGIKYCYDGDELKYIISKNGGVETKIGIIELNSDVDESYFMLPEDYEMFGD